MKFGLRNTRLILRSVGNPEKKFRSIHIAGTNGKGSTAAFLSSILMEAGYRTALYTSPHLVRFTERIRINGEEISERRLVEYAKMLRPLVEQVRATFFEATTCIAFQYFADEQVDVAVIEAGLGGRLDSTNVLLPMASIITNIGLDHTDILGKTIAAIAREKGGIIKTSVPCVTGSEDPVSMKVLGRIAERKATRVLRPEAIVKCRIDERSPGIVSFQSGEFSIPRVRLGLRGPHQLRNAQVAIAVLDVLHRDRRVRSFVRRLRGLHIKKGLENVLKNSQLRGRLEQLGRPVRYILDVAHNPPGIRTLVHALRLRGYSSMPVVFGVMKDKDCRSMVKELAPVSQIIITVAPSFKRAKSAISLNGVIRQKRIPSRVGGTVTNGVRMARSFSSGGSPILITGSHYVVGEALQFLEGKA